MFAHLLTKVAVVGDINYDEVNVKCKAHACKIDVRLNCKLIGNKIEIQQTKLFMQVCT